MKSVTYDTVPCRKVSLQGVGSDDGPYTTFLSLEDDLSFGWSAIQSWACDTAALEPLNLTRALFRCNFVRIIRLYAQ